MVDPAGRAAGPRQGGHLGPAPPAAEARDDLQGVDCVALARPRNLEGAEDVVLVAGPGRDAGPTFRGTGLETESPRGRIYLMTEWKRGTMPFDEEQVKHIDLCLGCRTCEGVCPSGVPYGRIIEAGRADVEDVRRPSAKRIASRVALRQLLAHPGRLRAAGAATRVAQRLGLTSVARSGRMLPRLRPRFRPPVGNVAQASGKRKYRVAFLVGCVMPILYPQSHTAAVRMLQLAGCDVWFPPGERCCGALFAHNGDLESADRLRDGSLAGDLLVVGAYPGGSDYDLRRGDPAEHDEVVSNIARVGLPEQDPVSGRAGPLLRLWSL